MYIYSYIRLIYLSRMTRRTVEQRYTVTLSNSSLV